MVYMLWNLRLPALFDNAFEINDSTKRPKYSIIKIKHFRRSLREMGIEANHIMQLQ